MLDFIRSNAQSMGVKLIFGLIILVFIFWGVGSITDTSGGSVVAVVNGDGISAGAFFLLGSGMLALSALRFMQA